MSTGDLKNNVKKLQTQLKAIRYTGKLDLDEIRDGSPTAFLPMYHYVFTSYSSKLNKDIASSNNQLYGKSDLRFIEAVYKILRDMFSYKPPVTRDQFFQPGFSERKVIMATEIVRLVHSLYTPPGGSNYKLASKLEKKQHDLHTKVQVESSVQMNQRVQAKPRKVAGKSGADLTEAIVLPRYVSLPSSHSQMPVNGHPHLSDVPLDTNNSASISHHAPASTSPRSPVSELPDAITMQFTERVTNALTMLNTQVGKISVALQKVENQIACNESPRIQPAIKSPTSLTDKLQMDTVLSKVILLENRMTMLETKVEDIQNFCTILLETRSPTSNNTAILNNQDATPLAPSIVNEKRTELPQERELVESNRMHPDYMRAFAPVADLTKNHEFERERLKDESSDRNNGFDNGDEMNNEEAEASNKVESRTGNMDFMKTLMGPNDSEMSLSRDQDNSTISFQDDQRKDNPHLRTRQAWSRNDSNSDVRNCFGNAFSPIRGGNEDAYAKFDDSNPIHIPYSTEEDILESHRLSSTPNKEDLDSSTISRVNRIMQMMKETQEHINQKS